jgi:hypothetical protein
MQGLFGPSMAYGPLLLHEVFAFLFSLYFIFIPLFVVVVVVLLESSPVARLPARFVVPLAPPSRPAGVLEPWLVG